MSATTMQMAASSWGLVKAKLTYLVIGLLAGPVITDMAGWQVTRSEIQDQVHAGIVEQQALYCEAKARIEMPAATMLSYGARDKLAMKWAVMPGATTTDIDVVRACARKLAS